MKTAYLDTSVVLGIWAPTDPHHEAIRAMIGAMRNGALKGFVSTLGLCEAASVVERQKAKFSSLLDAPDKNIPIPLSLEYLKVIIELSNVFIVDCTDTVTIRVRDKSITLPIVYWKAIELAPITALRSLDNLHLAIAYSLLECLGERVDYFITNDEGILNKGSTIKKTCHFTVLSPNELVSIEGFRENST